MNQEEFVDKLNSKFGFSIDTLKLVVKRWGPNIGDYQKVYDSIINDYKFNRISIPIIEENIDMHNNLVKRKLKQGYKKASEDLQEGNPEGFG